MGLFSSRSKSNSEITDFSLERHDEYYKKGFECIDPYIIIHGRQSRRPNTEKIKEGIKLTRIAGIKTICFFLFGLPTETIKDMQKTIEFAQELNPTYASFHLATPYPGTIFYEMIEDKTNELFHHTILARFLQIF